METYKPSSDEKGWNFEFELINQRLGEFEQMEFKLNNDNSIDPQQVYDSWESWDENLRTINKYVVIAKLLRDKAEEFYELTKSKAKIKAALEYADIYTFQTDRNAYAEVEAEKWKTNWIASKSIVRTAELEGKRVERFKDLITQVGHFVRKTIPEM